jgi:hypothetical protein
MSRSLLVVNYPALSAEELEKIQSVRRQHDLLNYDVVAPHFTLVFPVFDHDEKSFIAHVEQIAQSLSSFDFVIRCAVLGDDAFSDYTHVFLVPDEGYSRIVRLHDLLYTGILASELRLDIPFIPHIGIANDLNPQVCKTIVDTWNATDFEIWGKVQRLDVIWYEENQVGTIAQFELAQ